MYGSVARGDDTPESDLDLLVAFSADAEWGLLDHVQLEEELSELLGRQVDMQTKRAVQESRNPIRRDMILNEAEPFIRPEKRRSDAGILADIIECCQQVQAFAQGLDELALRDDRKTQSAIFTSCWSLVRLPNN